mmetsp:Transcript_92009/g.231348  ORF Transcript_92009/g.231348 Transcript_92009/m.231348 type:complete len:1176 (+) Transcript_92009:56-3583(+)
MVHASRWELFLAGQICCPLCSCCLWFGIGWIWVIIFVAKIFIDGGDLFSFDAQDVKSDVVVQRHYAFLAARGDEEGCFDQDHEDEDVCKNDDRCEWWARKCREKSVCPKVATRERESFVLYDSRPAQVLIVYETPENVNILDDEILGYIDKFEKTLLTTANGAKFNGAESHWDKDWCQMAYPGASPGNATEGKCSSISSFADPYAMTAKGLEAVQEQVSQGYTVAGALSCMCTLEDRVCDICNADGTEKDLADWPSRIKTCMMEWLTAADSTTSSAAPTTGNTSETDGICLEESVPMTMANIPLRLKGFCKSMPSCQFAPPGASSICSSTAFYRPTDTSGLLQGADKDAILAKMCDDTNPAWTKLRSSILPMTFDCDTKKTNVGKTRFSPGGTGEEDGSGETFEKQYVSGVGGWLMQEQRLEAEIEDASDGKLRVMMWSSATLRSSFLGLLIVDSILSIGALVMVWLYMFWTLESAFLASCAIFEILFSVPVAMSLWAVVFQQKVSVLQVLVLYMILGIGADDAFILYDAWLQARHQGEEVNKHWTSRFAWAYRRSFSAMAVTTSTTCGSFMIGAFSPLPQVRDFCIFAAIVVLVDWLFCITFFASATVVHDRYIRSDRRRGECCGPGCCCGLVQCCAAKCCPKLMGPPPEANALPQKRAMERWSEGPVFSCLLRLKWLFIVLWVLVIIAFGVSAALNLRTAEKAPPLGKESLDVTRVAEILMDHYSVFGAPTTAVAWGIDKEDPIKEWGSGDIDDNVPRFSAASVSKLTSPQGQEELLDLCRAPDLGKDSAATRCSGRECLVLGPGLAGRCAPDEAILKKTGIYIPEDIDCAPGRYCFMEEFARFWAYKVQGEACTGVSSELTCTSLGCLWDATLAVCYSSVTEDDYLGLPASDFIAHLGSDKYKAYQEERISILQATGRSSDIPMERMHTGFHLNAARDSLTFAWISFNATYPVQNTVVEANEWYDRWESFHTLHAPDIGGIQTTELYLFMVTQNEMVRAATMGIILSLVMAFFVMVFATANWWVSLLGMANITGISVVFLGLIPMLGWSLGEYECIFLIAVVGLSVDYTLHLLHVFNHSYNSTREDRARHALAEMGISVTNSAITTLLAASMLFCCSFYFFLQFGGFIFLVISISIIMSITFLIPLLVVLGPQKWQGEISCLKCRRCGYSSE